MAPHPLDDRRLVRVRERRVRAELAEEQRAAEEQDSPAETQADDLPVPGSARSQHSERAHSRYRPADRRGREAGTGGDVGHAQRERRLARTLHHREHGEHAELPVGQVIDGEGEALWEHSEERRAETQAPPWQRATDGERRNPRHVEVEHLTPGRRLCHERRGCVGVDAGRRALHPGWGPVVHRLPPSVVAGGNTGFRDGRIKRRGGWRSIHWNKPLFRCSVAEARGGPFHPYSCRVWRKLTGARHRHAAGRGPPAEGRGSDGPPLLRPSAAGDARGHLPADKRRG